MLTVNSKRWLYRVALFLFCGVLSMLFTGLDAPATQAKPLQQDLSNYRFIHHIGRDDLCLEVTGSSTASGARVELQDCFYTADDKDSQLWRFEDQSNGFALIRARHSNMCLGVEGNSTALAAYINQYPCNSGNDSHLWKYTYDAAKERLVQIKNKRSNLFLVSVLATTASLFIPNTIHDNAELVDMRYGWPLPFIFQDSSRFQLGGDGPPLPYPRALLSPWEIPTTFSVLPFGGNMILWGLFFGALWWRIVKFAKQRRQKSETGSAVQRGFSP